MHAAVSVRPQGSGARGRLAAPHQCIRTNNGRAMTTRNRKAPAESSQARDNTPARKSPYDAQTASSREQDFNSGAAAAADFLDLDADPPPQAPKSIRMPVVAVRVPAHLALWLRHEAWAEGVSMNRLLVRFIERARHAELPPDVRDWLQKQAAQCGCPHDTDRALIMVIRHLADRWPQGARLRTPLDARGDDSGRRRGPWSEFDPSTASEMDTDPYSRAWGPIPSRPTAGL